MAQRREHLEAAREECLRLGATFSCERRGKHYMVTVCINGQCRKTSMSVTPSDWRVTMKVRAIIRKYVAEMKGLTSERVGKALQQKD